MGSVTNDWLPVVEEETKKEYYKRLYIFLKDEYSHHIVYPKSDDIFNALHLTPLSEVKVVILGQDPYHEPGQAEGLSFSVPKGEKIPPSLQNIYKELQAELGLNIPETGSLRKWAKQGVLLLNTLLTVKAHEAFSHKGRGWEYFTDALIRAVNKEDRPIVYLLWGKAARDKKEILSISYWNQLTQAHCQPIEALWGMVILKEPMNFLLHMV